MNQKFVSQFGQSIQRGQQLRSIERNNEHGPANREHSREGDKPSLRLFDYEMSSPKRSSRQPNFGRAGQPDCETLNDIDGEETQLISQEAAWCRLRTTEQQLLPEWRHRGSQQLAAEGSHIQSIYTEETNPAMLSMYLEKNQSSKNRSPREPEHLKKLKPNVQVSREKPAQMLQQTEETVLLNENYNYHQFSPRLRTSSTHTHVNIPEQAPDPRPFEHLNLDSNRIQDTESVVPRRRPDFSGSSCKRGQTDEPAERLNNESHRMAEPLPSMTKHSFNQVALKRPITKESPATSQPSVDQAQPSSQDKFWPKLGKRHEEMMVQGPVNAGLRHISFADHAPPAVSTIETQSQRSPRREDESQLIDRRALLERERGSRFGERDKRALHFHENTRSHEIPQRSPPVVEPKIIVKAPQHLQARKQLPHHNFGGTLGAKEGEAVPQQLNMSNKILKQSLIGEEVQREDSAKAGPNSRSSKHASNSKLRNTSNTRDSAKDFTDKLLSLKNTLTNIRSNMYKRSKSSLFSEGSRNVTSSHYDKYFQEKGKHSRQAYHLAKEDTGYFHEQQQDRREHDLHLRMYSDELPSNAKQNDLSTSHMNMTGLDEHRMFANLNQSKENVATEEHQRFDSFHRSQEHERLPTNPGKSTNNPSFKLDFMKLNRTRPHRQGQTQKPRCLSGSSSGIPNQMVEQHDHVVVGPDNFAGCSCCPQEQRHQQSRHQPPNNHKKMLSCQEGDQPLPEIGKADSGNTKIKSSQYDLKEVRRASQRARAGPSQESGKEQATARGVNPGLPGGARPATKRSSVRSRSEVEAHESPRNLPSKSTLRTQRHPLTEQLSAREIFLSNGSLDVHKLLTLIAGTQDSRKSGLDPEIQQICSDQLNNLKIQDHCNTRRVLQKSKSQSIRNLHSNKKSVAQPSSRTYNHIYQETNLLRKVLHLLQENYPSARKPEPVPHAKRFALYKQKLQKYSSRQSLQTTHMNSPVSMASPAAALSKQPTSTQPAPARAGQQAKAEEVHQHQESYQSLQTRIELLHRHAAEQQELLEMAKQAEMRKDRRNKELKEAVEEGRRAAGQLKEDIQVLLVALDETEAGRERLRRTQINLENAQKSCRTCHPWEVGGLDIKSQFANEIVKSMIVSDKILGQRASSAKQFLESIEQALNDSNNQSGQQQVKLSDQETIDEFCKRLNKEKRFIAKVQRMVRDQEKNFFFTKESQINDTSIKMQSQATMPKLSECWKWQKNLVNEFNQLKRVKENFEEIIQNQNQLISQLLDAKHLKGLMDRDFNEVSMQLRDYPGSSSTSNLVDRKMQTHPLSRSQYLLPPKSSTSYSNLADPSCETHKISSHLSSRGPKGGKDKRKKPKAKAEAHLNSHRTNQASHHGSNQLTLTPSVQTSQQHIQEACEGPTTFSLRPRQQTVEMRDLHSNQAQHLSRIDESTIDRVGCGESKEICTYGRLEQLGPPTLSLGSGDEVVVNSNQVSMGNVTRVHGGRDQKARQSPDKSLSYCSGTQRELEKKPRGPCKGITKRRSLRRRSNNDGADSRRAEMREADLILPETRPLPYHAHHHPQQSLPNFQALASLNSPEHMRLEGPGDCVVNILTPQIGPDTEPSSQAHGVEPAQTPSNVDTLKRSSQTQPNRMMDSHDLETARHHLPLQRQLPTEVVTGRGTAEVSPRSVQAQGPVPVVSTPPAEEDRSHLYAPHPLPRHKRHKSMGRNISSYQHIASHSGTTAPHIQMSALPVEQLGGEWLASSGGGYAHHGHTGSIGSNLLATSARRVVYVSNLEDAC